MTQFYKLKRKDNNYYIYSKLPFNNDIEIERADVMNCFDFAYEMAFGKSGRHRANRSGGQARRKNGEIFANAFQGKLSEFVIYRKALRNGVELDKPDISTHELGIWDSYDFEIGDMKIAVKSTKHYGSLLLLETKDWNSNGEYIPNLEKGTSKYDFFVLVRIKPSIDDMLKKARLMYSDDAERRHLQDKVSSERWQSDILGYITHDDFLHIIADKFILPQNSMLNGNTKMDAENYYAQGNNMRPFDELLTLLARKIGK